MKEDNWEYRNLGMICKTCIFFVPKKEGVTPPREKDDIKPPKVSSGIGRCRRHAPTMNGYPVVFPTDWCGDHKLDEVKIG